MQFLKHSLLPIKSKSDEIWVSDEDHFNRAFNTFLLIKNPSTWAKLLNWFEIQSHASMCNYRKQSFTVVEKVLKTCFLCVLLLLDMKFKLRTHSRHSLKEKSVMLSEVFLFSKTRLRKCLSWSFHFFGPNERPGLYAINMRTFKQRTAKLLLFVEICTNKCAPAASNNAGVTEVANRSANDEYVMNILVICIITDTLQRPHARRIKMKISFEKMWKCCNLFASVKVVLIWLHLVSKTPFIGTKLMGVAKQLNGRALRI